MSTTVYLVRHGEAAESWEHSLNPGLSERGERQALDMAERLHREIAPADLFCSPLQRTRETAKPLADLWEKGEIIAPELSEIPSAGLDLGNRRAWLTQVLEGKWSEQSDHLRHWRSTILDFTARQTRNSVFVTHFVVINAIVGAIGGSDDIVVFRPDHCSVTKLLVANGKMSLIEKGREAVTVVK